MSNHRAAVAATIVGLCVAALPIAAMGQRLTHGTIPQVGVQQTDRALVESTLDVFPQISHTVQDRYLSPENATPFLPPPSTRESGLFPMGSATLPHRMSSHGTAFPGIGFTGWVPPDPNVAAGPTALVETVNSTVAFFKKDGTMTFEQDMVGPSGFFSGLGAGSFIYDPKVAYDRNAGRFYVVALEFDQGAGIAKILLAVSATSNPNGVWYKYRIEAKLTVGGNTYWMDYPSLGFNKSGIMMNGSMFAFGAGGVAGVQFLVIPKALALKGLPLTATSYLDANTFSAQSARSVDANVPVIYGAVLTSGSSMRLYAMKDPGGTPKMDFVDLAIPAYFDASGTTDSVGGSQLESLPGRIFGLEYRNGKLYTGHTVGTSNSDPTPACRWYELNVNTWPASGAPSVSQTGNIAVGNGIGQSFPAINVNGAGDISVCFTKSSTSIVSDMMMAGRRSTDPPGFVSAPVALKHGVGTYGGPGFNRWGDYFDVAIDPSDDLTFWGICMVSDTNGAWVTEIQKWKISTGLNNLVDVNPSKATKYVGGQVFGNVASLFALDGDSYTIQSVPTLGIGQAAGMTLAYNLGVTGDKLASLGFKFESAGSQNLTAFVYAFNVKTQSYDFIKTVAVGTRWGTLQTVQLGNIANYVDATGNVSVVVRSLAGSNNGNNPFTFSTDLAHVVYSLK